jgi:RNA polymerase sigma-70 factor (ECF subfamily)
MGVCFRYTNRREEAKDILQEAFIKIFKNIKKLRKEESLLGWMKRITIYTAINTYRAEKAHNQTESIELANNHSTDYIHAIDHLNKEYILELIQQLPNGYRTVFNLYAIDGYKHREIAELLNISENTSKTQLKMAREQLKIALRKSGIIKYENYV